MTEGNEAHVHHLLVYLCDGLSEAHVGNGGDCRDGVANEVVECRGGTLIAAWAVGGEVSVYARVFETSFVRHINIYVSRQCGLPIWRGRISRVSGHGTTL